MKKSRKRKKTLKVVTAKKKKAVSLTRAALVRTLGKDAEIIASKRNTKYTVKLGEEICTRMAHGETVTSIVRDEHMPSWMTIVNWRSVYPAFEELYVKSQIAQLEYWAEQVKDIADDGRNDWMERESRNGTYTVLNSEHVTRSMLRINTIKWIASIRNPAKYGAKVELNASEQLKNVMDSFASAVTNVNNVDALPMLPALEHEPLLKNGHAKTR